MGAGVWIEFEGGDVSRPIWTGCYWHLEEAFDRAPREAFSDSKKDPAVKVIKTKNTIFKLDDTEDGDQSLLHRSMVVYGSGLGDGNRHNHMDLPVLIAGRGNGELHPGRHLRLPRRTPMANLYLTMLHKLSIPAKSFADSRGTLDI